MSAGPKGDVTLLEPSRAEAAHARRVSSAKATVPELALRASTSASASLGQVVHACARALREHPRVNASYRDGRFELHGRVNIAVSEDGLLAPTIFDADTKELPEIAAELDALLARGRAGELAPTELSGATFTVATLDVRGFTAVLNPPQAAVLAVGVAGAEGSAGARPGGGGAGARPGGGGGGGGRGGATEVTLTCDHRILFGPEAAAFLGHVVAALESC